MSTMDRPQPVVQSPRERAGARPVTTAPPTGPSALAGVPAGAAGLLALQRQAGNRAVAAALRPASGGRPRPEPRRVPVVQRSPVIQRAPTAAERRQLEAKLPALQTQTGLLDAHATLGEAYGNLALGATDLISSKLQLFALRYDQAWGRYSRVIGAGRAEAQNQTLWRGIFLGIGTGVLAGVAAAFVAPSTAAGWFTLTLADAATAAGSSLLQAGFSSAVALALSDALTVRGSDLQPTGLTPDMLRTNIWQQVAQMYRGAFGTTRVTTNLLRNAVALERTIAEMRVHIAGGSSDYSTADVLRAADVMSTRLAGMQSVFSGLRRGADDLRRFSDAVVAYDPMVPTVDQMEDDIWIMWIGSLSDDDSDILDLDAIEDHLHRRGILGPGSQLGVDFGSYTSEDDELAAIAAGRRRAGAIRDRYDQAASRWNRAPGP